MEKSRKKERNLFTEVLIAVVVILLFCAFYGEYLSEPVNQYWGEFNSWVLDGFSSFTPSGPWN